VSDLRSALSGIPLRSITTATASRAAPPSASHTQVGVPSSELHEVTKDPDEGEEGAAGMLVPA
jgi:hypothetical protein